MKSKQVLIATMHRGNNYGSALQAYALSESIKLLGHHPFILDYIPERADDRNNIKGLINTLFSFNSITTKYNALRGVMILISSHICYNSFFKKHLNLTAKYIGSESVLKNPPIADIYLTGSDQVWNSVHNKGIDPIFFLEFASDNNPKVSYSASFGREKLDEWEQEETKRLLRRYDAISVREKSGVEILSSLGIQNGKCVLDPTLLLTIEEWRERVIHHNVREKYVLIYSVEPNKQAVIKAARSVADNIGAKVYMVEWGRKPYNGVDKMLSLINPLMLIDYFDKAEFVVASSFHGTALSINLNKPFITIAPAKFNTRVQSILELTGLEDRLFSPKEAISNIPFKSIDFAKVNNRLNELRNESLKYLKSILDD